MLVTHTGLIGLVTRICAAAGTPQQEAAQVACHLVEANLRGHDSHGVGMLPVYIQNIASGVLNPSAHVKPINDSGSILILDAQAGFGQVVGPEAMDLAIGRARSHGLCAMALQNAHHLGRIGGLGEQAAEAGLISLHFVNVVGHAPFVAPFGGAIARLGTNPFCCAIPLPDADAPFVFDMATSTIALGKARVAHNKGEPVPSGCLIDHLGQPTTDPGVMFSAPMGALTAVGEHKGFGLALACELLAGALVGCWTAENPIPKPTTVINHMLTLVIDPGAIGSREAFLREAGKLVSYIRETRPAATVDSVMIPGDPERRSRAQRLAEGIPIDDMTWRGLVSAAASVGVSAADCESISGPVQKN